MTVILSFRNNLKLRTEVLDLTILFFFALAFTLTTSGGFFFWDNVIQISAPANWYYENNFSSLFAPDNIATGHPPLIGLYLAAAWKIFGRSILISHLAMLPFTFGVLAQIYILAKLTSLSRAERWLVLLIILADPTLLSQLSLVTFEVPQMFFFLLTINSVLRKRRLLQGTGFMLLILTSLRGTICGGGIVLYIILYEWKSGFKYILKELKYFLPGIFVFLLFISSFYLNKGWVVHNSVSQRWEGMASFEDIRGIARNVLILVWRLIDFGRIGIWVTLFLILYRAINKGSKLDEIQNKILILGGSQLAVMALFTIPFSNTLGHRYFLPVIVLASLFVGVYVIKTLQRYAIILLFNLLLLIAGSLLIYPDHIAQGWDSTPAHWGYYGARKEMIEIITQKYQIDEKIGTFYPNIESPKYIDLEERQPLFKAADISSDQLIFYSNVFNIDDATLNELFSSGRWVKSEEVINRRIRCILFSRKE